MLGEFFFLPWGLAIFMAVFVSRLNEWLPLHMAAQENELITEILATHATDPASNRQRCSVVEEGSFWQRPANTLVNASCAGSIFLVVLAAFYVYPLKTQAYLWALWSTGLVLLAFVDARTKLLPDVLTLPLLWLGLIIQLFSESRTVGLELSVIGAVAGYLPLWLLVHAYRLVRGRDGLGMGDLKLLAAMGAWSGPFVLPQVLLLAALLAIAVFVLERLLRRSTGGIHEERPFGPAIVAAYFIVTLLTY